MRATLQSSSDIAITIDRFDSIVHMERVQIQLTDGQLRALRARSSATGQPIAALVRDAVDEWLPRADRERRVQRALAAIGRFQSGLGDLAEDHDRYLDDGPAA